MRVFCRALMNLVIGVHRGIARAPILLAGAARNIRGRSRRHLKTGGELAHLIADRIADLLGRILGGKRVCGPHCLAHVLGGLLGAEICREMELALRKASFAVVISGIFGCLGRLNAGPLRECQPPN